MSHEHGSLETVPPQACNLTPLSTCIPNTPTLEPHLPPLPSVGTQVLMPLLQVGINWNVSNPTVPSAALSGCV